MCIIQQLLSNVISDYLKCPRKIINCNYHWMDKQLLPMKYKKNISKKYFLWVTLFRQYFKEQLLPTKHKKYIQKVQSNSTNNCPIYELRHQKWG